MKRRSTYMHPPLVATVTLLVWVPASGFLVASDVAARSVTSSSLHRSTGTREFGRHQGPLPRGVRSKFRTESPTLDVLFQAKVEVTPDLVRKTAGLAQIQVTEEEVDLLVPRMEEFIGFVETMGEVDQADEGTFATLSCGNDFLREDNAEDFANVAAVMENMPVEEGQYLRVPKVGEDEA